MRHLASVGLVLSLAAIARSADWPHFRGPLGDGTVAKLNLPDEWSEKKNLAWKVTLPGTGWGQPVVAGGLVFVTTASGDGAAKPPVAFETSVKDLSTMFGGKKPTGEVTWELHAFELKSGNSKWSKKLAVGKPQLPVHISTTFAPETVATDGERVFVWVAQIGMLFAVTTGGELAWKKEIGVFPMAQNYGTGASPIVEDGRLFLQCDNEKASFLLALDPKNGEEIWRTKRSAKSSWSTPYLWKSANRTDLVALGNGLVAGYDPATGAERWRVTNLKEIFVASPVGTRDRLFLGANSPFSDGPLYSIRAGMKGDISLAKKETANSGVEWSRKKVGPGLTSPVADGDYLYISNQSFLTCIEAKSGKTVYRERLPKTKIVIASPLIAEGKIVLLDEAGWVNVVATGPKFEVLSTNRIADTFWASPAVTGDRLVLRGLETLYCVGKTE